jgi:hypothetical protein
VELERGELLGQPAPVAVEDVPVVVVLGQDLRDRLPRRLDELRPLSDGGDDQGWSS